MWNGITGYDKLIQESRKPEGRKLHRSAGESSGIRARRKLMGKTEWFKKKSKPADDPEDSPEVDDYPKTRDVTPPQLCHRVWQKIPRRAGPNLSKWIKEWGQSFL